MIDISTDITGIKLDGCVFNASGLRDETLSDLENLAKSKSSAILTKTCTLKKRKGNPPPRYANLEYGSINSMGFPNLGYKAYVKFSKILKKESKKPFIISISGFSTSDIIKVFKAFNDTPVDLIEFNSGCPNIIGKPIVGYDFEEMDRLLNSISKVTKKPFGVKFPPFFELTHFEQMANVIKKYPVKFVTCVNALGNGLAIDPKTEKTIIKPKGGLGAVAGKYIKFTGLGNVRKFYELLGDKVQVVGVGGIYTGTDVFEYILAGASAVQIGTAFLQKGFSIFETVRRELREIMKEKGYSKLSDFQGKLKTL